MAKKDDTKKKKRNIVRDTFHGRFLSVDFFLHHWLEMVGLVCMLLIYISSRYQCQMLMEEIRRLEQQLEIVQTERVREKGEYMSRIRESSMQEMVDSLHLGLRIQEQPPYSLP